MVLGMMIGPALAEEGHEDLTKHVERGHPRRSEAQQPQERVSTAVLAGRESPPQNLILREKPRQGRDTGNREGRDKKRDEGIGQLLSEPAHLAHILLSTHGVNHATRAKEQTCLEEGMSHKMEDRGGIGANSHTQL